MKPYLFLTLSLTFTSLAADPKSCSLQGVVSDPSNRPVAGVQLTARETVRGIEGSTVSDAAGRFCFRILSPGPYNLLSRAQGYDTLETFGIIIREGQPTNHNVVLTPAQSVRSRRRTRSK